MQIGSPWLVRRPVQWGYYREQAVNYQDVQQPKGDCYSTNHVSCLLEALDVHFIVRCHGIDCFPNRLGLCKLLQSPRYIEGAPAKESPASLSAEFVRYANWAG